MVGRLFQIIYLLMENERMSARELAQRLEVSVRTVNRDIEKLSEARIPIYTTRGRDGGLSLLPDFVLNKKVLSNEEKSEIISSIKLMGTVSYDDENQALRRLEDFFGKTAQDWIDIELDNWGEGVFDKERFSILKQAILSRRKVSFEYMKHNEISNRIVRPCKLKFKSQSWYLYAFCEERQDYRYFKFHRMKNLKVLDEKFEPLDPPFEEECYQNTYPKFKAEIAIHKSVAYRAYDELDSTNAREEGDMIVFPIDEADESWLIPYVLSYGENAMLLSPKYLCEKIRTIAAKIAEMYS